ncbi:HYD1 signature containing ADP-ribosyltransferase family protein [Pendulispora albinea]|uniref:HYD1 signature containing ADP-ribosyltransferase family protein n=1 Tax=Pendulispora albinea TaxID=2741071 RepID=UPI00374E139C
MSRPSATAPNRTSNVHGNGRYLTDVIPGTRSAGSLSATFLGVPWRGVRYSHYIEIDTAGLNVAQGRSGVFLVPNDKSLNISGRIMSFGQAH